MSASNITPVVLTAHYNNHKFFPEYLEGIRSQQLVPKYVVFVDDCSTDNSIEEINNYLSKSNFKKKDNYWEIDAIKLFILTKDKNQGTGPTRNRGLNFITESLPDTNIICVCDADDVYYSAKIKKSVDIFLKYQHIGLVYSDYDVYNIKTKELVREYKEPYSLGRLFNECIISNNSVYTIGVVKTIGLYDEQFFGPEDYDYWLRIAKIASVYHIPESLYRYTISGQNITMTRDMNKYAHDVMKVKQKALNNIGH